MAQQQQQTSVDRYYLFVVISIVALGIISLGGYIFLLATSQKPAPELLNVAFACAGALFGGVLKPSSSTSQESNDIVSQLGAKAAIAIIQENLKEQQEGKK